MSLTLEERHEIKELMSEFQHRNSNLFKWSPFERKSYELLRSIYNNDNKK